MIEDPTYLPARIRYLVVRLAAAAIGATVIVAGVVFFFRGQTGVAVHWYIVALGVLLLIALYRFIADVHPVGHRSALDVAWQARPPDPERPQRLEDLERQIHLGLPGANDFRYRLRPLLRELATHLLTMHRSIDAEIDPIAARKALGEDVWETLWPPAEQVRNGHGPVGDLGKLNRIVEVLENLEDNSND